MSGERRFVDTNVLVYLLDDDEPRKQAIAPDPCCPLTEDVQNGQDFDGVRIEDPFARPG